MTTKTITITEDAFERIKRLKRGGESFSELFTRLTSSPASIDGFFGILKTTEKELKEGRKRLKEIRKRVSNDIDRRKDAIARQFSNF